MRKLMALLLGIAISILILECYLRATQVSMRDVIENDPGVPHKTRVYTNPKNRIHTWHHPDLQSEHLIIYNSLGCRQHREFSEPRESGILRIGLFGDSFGENRGTEIQYSLTEPLDWLLNRCGITCEVMNFANCGYGLDQTYLKFKEISEDIPFDIIIYLYYSNDIQDILDENIFKIDNNGQLAFESRPSKLFIRLMKIFYFSNLLHSSLRSQKENFFHNQYDEAKQIFQVLLKKMKSTTKTKGSLFFVTSCPSNNTEKDRHVYQMIRNIGIDLVIPIPRFDEKNIDYRFKKDLHWNELGNRKAASSIFKYLAKAMDIQYEGDQFINRELSIFYKSFGDCPLFRDIDKGKSVTPTLAKKIRETYLSLENHGSWQDPNSVVLLDKFANPLRKKDLAQ